MGDNFGYTMIGECQYDVATPWRSAEQHTDCGAPGVAHAYWYDDEGSIKGKKMLVCAEHLEYMKKTEKELQ